MINKVFLREIIQPYFINARRFFENWKVYNSERTESDWTVHDTIDSS